MIYNCRKPGVYEIKNTINNKIYIGSSVNVGDRLSHHLRMLKKGTHTNRHLQRAFIKYGENAFVFKIMFLCGKSELLIYEQWLIDSLNPEYNNRPDASSNLGVVFSEESISNMCIARRKMPKRTFSEEAKKHISEARKRSTYVPSEETRKKMGDACRRRVWTKESREKLSKSLMGVSIGNCRKGQQLTKEHREKISKSWEKRRLIPISDETRKRMSEGQKRRTPYRHTEESKAKIKASWEKRRIKSDSI